MRLALPAAVVAAGDRVGLVHVECRRPIALETAWFRNVNLKCDLSVSKFAFKWVNLYHYNGAMGAHVTKW
jgi:hypothetical protein